MMTSQQKPNHTQYPLSPQDANTVATIRAQTIQYKGATFGPAGREGYDAIMNHVPPAVGVSSENGVVGGVKGWWCTPAGACPGVAILFLHGGGYVMGSASAYRNFAGHFAQRMQAAAFVADYRLGPEHPFPAALDDAYAAYLGLVNAGFNQIVVVGDSAGGGLSLSLLAFLQAHANDVAIGPSAAVVMSPWTDLTMSGHSIHGKAEEELYLTHEMLLACAKMYLNGADATDPRASVVNGSMHELPPLQIHVGTSEILLDDSLCYAQRAQTESDGVSLHIWDGMPHVFQNCLGILQAADQSLEIMTSFVFSHLRQV
jgi:epsilon-lactone hydrolase